MEDFVRLVGPNGVVEVFGVRLVGVNVENGTKLLLTLVFIAATVLLARLVHGLGSWVLRGRRDRRVAFWFRQAVNLGTAVVLVLGFVPIWFDDPTRLATALGLVAVLNSQRRRMTAMFFSSWQGLLRVAVVGTLAYRRWWSCSASRGSGCWPR